MIPEFSPHFMDKLSFDNNGLIPAISQDWLDGAVLMMAWMNSEAIEKTINTGQVHYWSRSRQKIWRKGESSGHTQTLKSFRYDCDADVLLLSIEQIGNISCHTGSRSCFFREVDSYKSEINKVEPIVDACSNLYRTILDRKIKPTSGSYTNKLIEGGENEILKKIGEENSEFIMSCLNNDKNNMAEEAADMIYHIQVALAFKNVDWRQVLEVLDSRKGAQRRSTS